jgi:hypothetical protein
MSRPRFRTFVPLALLLGAAIAVPAVRVLAQGDLELPVTHQHFNSFEAPAANPGVVPGSAAATVKSPICTAAVTTPDTRTDCEGNAPDNETTIAANPTNPLNVIAGANDYQITATGATFYESILSRAMVSQDGGTTWKTYPVPFQSYDATGDPAIAFDATGRAYYATLGFLFGQFSPTAVNPDVIVSTSTSGGTKWSTPVRVASGSGSFGSAGLFNDKEYIAAWGNGNAIVTWTLFLDGPHGSYLGSPIYASVTHDGGKTWSAGVAISGSAAFCTGFHANNACDQNQFSVPTVAADGKVYVAFENGPAPGSTHFEDQYLVVRVSPNSGARVAGPWRVGTLVDGSDDYPINVDGRQTLYHSQFRLNSAGNLTADPTDPSHLAISFSDMRNSPSANSGSTNPYTTATNSDVSVAESFDSGQTWSVSTLVGANDQFYPWAAFSPSGDLYVAYQDRSYDSNNRSYGFTLTRVGAGSQQLTTALSDPTLHDRWFSGGVQDNATTFLGDYNGLAIDASSNAHGLWTDMRNTTFFPNRTGFDEQIWTRSVSLP